MMNNNNNGFTLIELLAVIVIIALIATIATVSVTGVINKTKSDTKYVSVAQAQKALETYIIQNNNELASKIDESGYVTVSEEDLKNGKYISGKVGNGDGIYSWNLKYNNDDEMFTVEGDVSITVSLIGRIKNDSSLHTTQDNDGTTYYFSGKNAKNYVKIGNLMFRIVRINGDGTIRLIFNKSYPYKDGELKKIGSGSSRISDLDNYALDFLNLNIGLSNKKIGDIALINSKFCINEYDSVLNSVSNLKCVSAKTYKKQIGYLTEEEAILSGINSASSDSYITECNGSRCGRIYLYTIHSTSDSSIYGVGIRNAGTKIEEGNVGGIPGGTIRPVINISGLTTFENDGDGTMTNPYVVNSY